MARKRIIVADHNRIHFTLIEFFLSFFEVDVEHSDYKEPVIQLHMEKPYDMVITNMWGCTITGIELIRRLRNISPDLPCILLSAYPEAREEAIATLSPNMYGLDKPYRPEALYDIVCGVFGWDIPVPELTWKKKD